MFHIFRWRREHRNDNSTSQDTTNEHDNKKAHSRRHRLRVYHGRESLERFFHVRRHRLHHTHDNKQQVTRKKKRNTFNDFLLSILI